MNIESRHIGELPDDYLNEKGVSLFENGLFRLQENSFFKDSVVEQFLAAPDGKLTFRWPVTVEFDSNGLKYTVKLINTILHKKLSIYASDGEVTEKVRIDVSFSPNEDGSPEKTKGVNIIHQLLRNKDGSRESSINNRQAVRSATLFLKKI